MPGYANCHSPQGGVRTVANTVAMADTHSAPPSGSRDSVKQRKKSVLLTHLANQVSTFAISLLTASLSEMGISSKSC